MFLLVLHRMHRLLFGYYICYTNPKLRIVYLLYCRYLAYFICSFYNKYNYKSHLIKIFNGNSPPFLIGCANLATATKSPPLYKPIDVI